MCYIVFWRARCIPCTLHTKWSNVRGLFATSRQRKHGIRKAHARAHPHAARPRSAAAHARPAHPPHTRQPSRAGTHAACPPPNRPRGPPHTAAPRAMPPPSQGHPPACNPSAHPLPTRAPGSPRAPRPAPAPHRPPNRTPRPTFKRLARAPPRTPDTKPRRPGARPAPTLAGSPAHRSGGGPAAHNAHPIPCPPPKVAQVCHERGVRRALRGWCVRASARAPTRTPQPRTAPHTRRFGHAGTNGGWRERSARGGRASRPGSGANRLRARRVGTLDPSPARGWDVLQVDRAQTIFAYNGPYRASFVDAPSL